MWDSEEKDQWLRNKRMLSKEVSRHLSWRRQEETRVCSVSVRSNRISDLRGKKLKGSKKARTSQDFLCLGTWMNNDRESRRQSKYGGKVMSAEVNLSLKRLQDIPCQCRRQGLDPWVKKIPWRRKWQPTPVFSPGESHGQRSLAAFSPWGPRIGHDWATEQAHRQNISGWGQPQDKWKSASEARDTRIWRAVRRHGEWRKTARGDQL